MPYAKNGQISMSLIVGGVEITQAQYAAAIDGMRHGKLVSIDGGFSMIDPPEPATPEPEPIDPATLARAQRDSLLQGSDWTQLPDAPVDSEAWAVYRQELREVPDLPGFPLDIKWPNPPAITASEK